MLTESLEEELVIAQIKRHRTYHQDIFEKVVEERR